MESKKAKENWKGLEDEINSCTKCSLYKSKTNYVIGCGNKNAKIMLIGEAPGLNEDKLGIPFVGRSGRLLDELLEGIGLKRSDIYIANTIKCRPENNRDPSEKEKRACLPYLARQIELIKPKIIVALGRHAMKYFFNLFSIYPGKISSCHGKAYNVESPIFCGIFIVLYHPAVAVYNNKRKDELISDFEKLKKLL